MHCSETISLEFNAEELVPPMFNGAVEVGPRGA